MKLSKGFTLIELLVVIAVVGVLAGAVIAMINPGAQLGRSRDAQRKNDIRVIKQAVEEYAVINGSYPNTGGAWVQSTSPGTWITQLNSGYLKKLPIDPINNTASPWITTSANYSYAYRSDGVYYALAARLESPTDPDRCEVKQYKRESAVCPGATLWCPTYTGQLYTTNNCNN